MHSFLNKGLINPKWSDVFMSVFPYDIVTGDKLFIQSFLLKCPIVHSIIYRHF